MTYPNEKNQQEEIAFNLEKIKNRSRKCHEFVRMCAGHLQSLSGNVFARRNEHGLYEVHCGWGLIALVRTEREVRNGLWPY
mgnify:CR=1 FL=1